MPCPTTPNNKPIHKIRFMNSLHLSVLTTSTLLVITEGCFRLLSLTVVHTNVRQIQCDGGLVASFSLLGYDFRPRNCSVRVATCDSRLDTYARRSIFIRRSSNARRTTATNCSRSKGFIK